MRLSEVVGELSSTALFVDYDGTIAPIVDDPRMAHPAPGAIDALVRLCGLGVRTTVVSGRPVDFLATMIASAGVDLIGVYGLERVVGGQRSEVAVADELRQLMASIERDAVARGPSGMTVENKGMSITLHYRQHPELVADVAALAAWLGTRWSTDVRRAKQSIELHPQVDFDKGSAVLELAGNESSVVYVGDDEGDVPAFGALDVLEGSGLSVVRVAVGSPELPQLLEALADIVVDGPLGVVEFLTG